MKKQKTVIKELRAELRYWQSRARLEASGLRRTRAVCKDIGAKMRKAQEGERGQPTKA